MTWPEQTPDDAAEGIPRCIFVALRIVARLTRRSFFFYLNENHQRRLWFGRF